MKIMFVLPTLTTRCVSVKARFTRTRLAALIAVSLLIAFTGRAQEKPAAPTPPAPENKPAEYVGSQTCQMCHEDIFNGFQKNPHQVVEADKKRGWATKACESCHGPGSKHAESA